MIQDKDNINFYINLEKSRSSIKNYNIYDELLERRFLFESEGFSELNGKEELLTAYCGLDPSIKQSGKSLNVKGPISKSGNKHIRRILFVTVQNLVPIASKSDPQNNILLYYQKKRNEGKHHYATLTACTTKLLRKIFAICKNASFNM